MQIELPYGERNLSLNIPDRNILDVITPKEIISPDRPETILKRALMNPIGSDRLSDIAMEGDKVSIVVDDYTRSSPTEDILTLVLDELKRASVHDSDILIIIATGTHTPPTENLVKGIVGDKIYRNYSIVSNDVDNGDYISVGKTKMGHDVEILRDYVESDVKILLGNIEYHYFAGYDGTRRSILPGISSMNTIQQSHKLMFDDNARTGVLRENPIHLEMNDAMHLAGCDFAFNVVLNSKRRVVGAWAGNPEAVLDAGTKMVDEMYKIPVKEKADIVVIAAGGYPHDIDLFQAYKAIHTALPVLNKDGVIVLFSECRNGYGNDIYYNWIKKYKTSEEIKKALMENFVMGAHKAYYHLKAVENHPIIIFSSIKRDEIENVFHLKHSNTPEEAIKLAFDIVGKDAKVRIVPEGTTTFLTLEEESN